MYVYKPPPGTACEVSTVVRNGILSEIQTVCWDDSRDSVSLTPPRFAHSCWDESRSCCTSGSMKNNREAHSKQWDCVLLSCQSGWLVSTWGDTHTMSERWRNLWNDSSSNLFWNLLNSAHLRKLMAGSPENTPLRRRRNIDLSNHPFLGFKMLIFRVL